MDLVAAVGPGVPCRAVRPVAVSTGRPAVDRDAVDGGDSVLSAGVVVHAPGATAVVGRRGGGDGVRGVHGDERRRDGFDAVTA